MIKCYVIKTVIGSQQQIICSNINYLFEIQQQKQQQVTYCLKCYSIES